MSIRASQILSATTLRMMMDQLVFLRLNQGVVAGWGRFTWQSLPPSGSRPAFYLPDFLLESKTPWLVPEFAGWIDTGPAFSTILQAAEFVRQWEWQSPNKDSLVRQFDSLKEMIRQKKLDKGVPVVSSLSEQSPWASEKLYMLGQILDGSKDQFGYGFWTDDGSGMLGSTPELLFELQDQKVKTMALAGTETLDGPSLLNDQKQVKEHDIVIDDIVQQIGPLGQVKKGSTYEWMLPSLKHLRTDIELTCNKPPKFEDLIERLHPTAALGAHPRDKGWEWLKSWPEAQSRKRFGAPFAVYWPGEIYLATVAIRNIQWDQSGSRINAGCGIVQKSTLEGEWREIHLKINSVKACLGLPQTPIPDLATTS